MEAINSKKASNLKIDYLGFKKWEKSNNFRYIKYLTTNVGHRPTVKSADLSERILVCDTDVYWISVSRTLYQNQNVFLCVHAHVYIHIRVRVYLGTYICIYIHIRRPMYLCRCVYVVYKYMYICILRIYLSICFFQWKTFQRYWSVK